MSGKLEIVGRCYITVNENHSTNNALPLITGKVKFHDDGDEYWIDFWPSKKGLKNVFSGNVLIPPTNTNSATNNIADKRQ